MSCSTNTGSSVPARERPTDRGTETRATLLVFGLGSEADRQRRPLLPARLARLEREVRDRCLEHALEAGREGGFRLELATLGTAVESPQVGADVDRTAQVGATFGDRVRDTLRRAWMRHPEGPIVLVGSDTPELATAHLLAALRHTRRDPDTVVVGPSPDGGFYLVAAARPYEAALADVRWCGAHARQDLVEALERMGRTVILLEPLADLDRPRDLLALLARDWITGAAESLARRIRSALRELARPLESAPMDRKLGDLATVRLQRGPPR